MRSAALVLMLLPSLFLAGCTDAPAVADTCLHYQVLQRDDADPDRLIVAASIANHGIRDLEGAGLSLVLNLTETTTGEVTTVPLEWSGKDVPVDRLVQEIYRLTPPANGTAFALGGHLVYEGGVVPHSAACTGLA